MENMIKALTIKERHKIFIDKNINVYEDVILIEQKWNNIKGLWTETDLENKLELYNIKKEEFAFLIKEYNDFEKAILENEMHSFEWYNHFVEIMGCNSCERSSNLVIMPFLNYFKEKIYSLQMHYLNFDPYVYDTLIDSLKEQLEMLVSKCIIIELEKYKQKNNPVLDDAYKDFDKFMHIRFGLKEDIIKFYEDYPVLARFATEETINYIKFIFELVKNLDDHYSKYCNIFNRPLGNIKNIKLAIGDVHNNGKTVTEITYDNNYKLIYKPRNSNMSKAYIEFCKYFNENAKLLDVFIPIIYFGGNFTIEEYIENTVCKNDLEINNFYYRFGEQLAIIGILQGNDIHSENLIAHGQYPVIIDCETLLVQAPRYNFKETFESLGDLFNLSATGMLPIEAINNNIEGKGIEISSLAGGMDTVLPKKMYVLKDKNTINMRYEYCNVQKKRDKNRPLLNGEFVNFTEYIGKVIEGFKDVLSFFAKNKEQLISVIKKQFSDIMTRVLVKPTAVYSELLLFVNHPDYLKDMLYVERLLDNMWAYPHINKEIVYSEIQEMLKLQIPVFYATTDNLFLQSEYVMVEKYYNISPIENIIECIKSINETSLNFEVEKLKVSLGLYEEMAKDYLLELHKKVKKNISFSIDIGAIRSVCSNIANTLLNDRIELGDNINWRVVNSDRKYPLIELSTNSLYDGNLGIALFLYFYGKVFKNQRISELCNTIINNINQDCKIYSDSIYERDSAYILLKLLVNNDILNAETSEFIINCYKNKHFHYFGGWLDSITGHIQLLSNLYEKGKCQKIIYDILQYLNSETKRLLSESKKIFDQRSIGLGHGEIGAVLSLLKLEDILGVSYAVEIESLLKEIEFKIGKSDINKLCNSWCHGYGGLGIGALECQKFLTDKRLTDFVQISLEKIKNQRAINMCLCHGQMGDIEFLLSYYKKFGDNEVYNILCNQVNEVVNFYAENDAFLVMEIPLFKNYGLFTGRAGIGYEFLRLLTIDDENVGNILLLDC